MPNIFDISVSTLTSGGSSSNMTKDEFVESVVPKVQAILDRMFPNDPQKRKIRVFKDRINFAAPCCGDSQKDKSKKRGNIILEGRFKNMYKCFNCGTCMSVQNFLSRYGQNLDLREINYISENKADFSFASSAKTSDFVNYFYDLDELETYAVPRDVLKNRLGLVECSENNAGHTYLVSRLQFDFSKFLYAPSVNKLFVLNLTPSGSILGLQVRRFDGRGPKYKTYSAQKIHEYILKDSVTVPDSVDTISMLFNLLLVDYSKPVTVTEGPMDSFVLKNAIALCGAGKNIDLPFECRYLFDCDKTGKQHAIDKLNQGDSVFMWDVYLTEAGLPFKSKWDINDVVIYAYKNKVNLPSIDGFFTSDILDLIKL